ncbi:hypothetical protein KIL84_005349 [Mauremys mutica]|uniref:Uncharacterized protein n=1 Tax=Mauremys mutica TaxID=74926 RepID=A0A9D3XKL2_9SAUR|nr:hypothetical protein KIL84_005349 [Mauremys mutica]
MAKGPGAERPVAGITLHRAVPRGLGALSRPFPSKMPSQEEWESQVLLGAILPPTLPDSRPVAPTPHTVPLKSMGTPHTGRCYSVGVKVAESDPLASVVTR